MRFIKYTSYPSSIKPRTVYLIFNKWDDYGFRTLFEAILVDDEENVHNLGNVKIMSASMSRGDVNFESSYEPLDQRYCSLGTSQNYYETLYNLPEELRETYLRGMRDCVFDSEIWDAFKDEEAMQDSLLRGVNARSVEGAFRRILDGNPVLTPFRFHFDIKNNSSSESRMSLEFNVKPDSLPPTNVHAFIGRNGVGKTRLISGIVNALTMSEPDKYSLEGELFFREDRLGQMETFAQLVVVSFSVFDKFRPLNDRELKGRIRYDYVGLKKLKDDQSELRSVLKEDHELYDEFMEALKKCLTGPRRERWIEAISIISSDRRIKDLAINKLPRNGEEDVICKYMGEWFKESSSGHKIVILTVTKLVQLVDEKTLILFDEPESHLHPPLLSSLIRSISNLLTKRNGVAILATHSPVVLQEVPRSCVYYIQNSGEYMRAERPTYETFAENVGMLTREAFGLEVDYSGYSNLLSSIAQGKDFDEVIEEFGGQIGMEGRAILRAVTVSQKKVGYD